MRFFFIMVIVLATVLVACAPKKEEAPIAAGDQKELTPYEFSLNTEQEKFLYRNIDLFIPEYFGFVLPPFGPGRYSDIFERLAHTGDVQALRSQIVRAWFELEHPRIKVAFIPFDTQTDVSQKLLTDLTADRAPSIYFSYDHPSMIEEGMFADITGLVDTWPEARDHSATRSRGIFAGSIYCLPDRELQVDVVFYRKDMFREAGIFNEDGEPGPPGSWTWPDFRRYAKMLTRDKDGDGQIDQWGFEMMDNDLLYERSMNVPSFVPDKSGRNTWRFYDGPEMLEAMRRTRAMYREDGSVRGEAVPDRQAAYKHFLSGKTAMVFGPSSDLLMGIMTFPEKYEKSRELIGMVFLPGGNQGLKNIICVTPMLGFNPRMSEEQLNAAFDWYRSWAAGTVAEVQRCLIKEEERILNKPDITIPRLLASSYKPEYSIPEIDFGEFFPGDYIYVYEKLRSIEYPPSFSEYGLKEPKGLNQVISDMRAELLSSPEVDPRELLAKTADIANADYLNFKQDNDVQRLKAYYEARLDFYKRNFPDYYPYYKQFVIENCKVW